MFLISQMLVFLTLALIIGGLIGYAFRACLSDNGHQDTPEVTASEKILDKTARPLAAPTSLAPFPQTGTPQLAALTPRDLEHELLAAAPGKSPKARFVADDLTAINGLTPEMDAFLADLGITRLADIADLTSKELYWLVDHLPGDGASLYRDQWVAQASRLLGRDGL